MNKAVIGARYNLRIEDFGDQHVLMVECDKCGHIGQVTAARLRDACKPY